MLKGGLVLIWEPRMNLVLTLIYNVHRGRWSKIMSTWSLNDPKVSLMNGIFGFCI